MSFAILADSASDLPLSYYQENNIKLLPLKVLLNNKEYEDLVSIEPITVYQAIRQGNMPKTSQVSPSYFEAVFKEMAVKREDGIYIAFSSELSGTYQTAVMVRDQIKEEYPDFNLTIIDSKCASLGYGLAVMEACRLAKIGAQMEDVINAVEFYCRHMEHLFTVDDLNHLAKGGRLSKSTAFLGSLLNIKPLLNVEDGKLVPIEKIRGHKKLLRRIIELMKERGDSLKEQIIGISHADNMETALEMKKLIAEEFGTEKIMITQIGATIGAHTGPGAISVFFLNKIPS